MKRSDFRIQDDNEVCFKLNSIKSRTDSLEFAD